MKLLFVLEHFSMQGSGMENDAVNLCLGLSKLGHEIHVCCETGEQYYDIVLHYDLQTFSQVVQEITPDLIIDWSFLVSADVHRVGGGIHQSYLNFLLRSYPPATRWIKKLSFLISGKHRKQIALEKKITSNPQAHYSAISHMIKQQLVDYGIDSQKVSVAFNGVNLQKFRPLPDSVRQQQRQKWGIKKDEKVALFVAHNLRLKNLKFAIDVVNQLNKIGIPFKLAICGKRRPLFLGKHCLYVGMTKELEKFYAASDILLHPSFYDSFGNIILEAMACHLPVITVDTVGAAEVIKPTDTLFLTRPIKEATTTQGAETWAKLTRQILETSSQDILKQKRDELEANYSLQTFIENFNLFIQEIHNKKTQSR